MSPLVHWFLAHPERILGAWVILAALVSLAVGGMISDADKRGRLDVEDEPTETTRRPRSRRQRRSDVQIAHDRAALWIVSNR